MTEHCPAKKQLNKVACSWLAVNQLWSLLVVKILWLSHLLENQLSINSAGCHTGMAPGGQRLLGDNFRSDGFWLRLQSKIALNGNVRSLCISERSAYKRTSGALYASLTPTTSLYHVPTPRSGFNPSDTLNERFYLQPIPKSPSSEIPEN